MQPQGPLLLGLDAPVGCVPLLKTWPELVATRQGAFDSFAMGNYPYPSTYMGGALPAWPMRAACDHLAKEKAGKEDLLQVRDTLSSPHCYFPAFHSVFHDTVHCHWCGPWLEVSRCWPCQPYLLSMALALPFKPSGPL